MVLQCLDEHSSMTAVHSNFGSEPVSLLWLLRSYPAQFSVWRELRNSSSSAHWQLKKILLLLHSEMKLWPQEGLNYS